MDKIAIPLKSTGSNGSGKAALTRLSVILAAVMLRRTKTTLIDGKPLLNLPSRTVNVQGVSFASNEQKFYNAIESKMKDAAKAIHRNADKQNKAMNFLSLLLRLRQASCHPHLINQNDVPEPIGPTTTEGTGDEVDDLAAMIGKIEIFKDKCEICRKRFDAVVLILQIDRGGEAPVYRLFQNDEWKWDKGGRSQIKLGVEC